MKYSSGIPVVLGSLLLTGCVTTSSAPSPSIPSGEETASPAQVRRTGEATSWKITPTDQPQTYTSHLTTVITQTDIPASRRDSLVTQTSYSITTTRSADTAVFSGSIESFVVQGDTVDSASVRLSTPVAFTGAFGNHQITAKLSSDNRVEEPGSCETLAQTPLKIIQRNLFLLPLQLTAGQTWTDSTSSHVCNGTLQTINTVIRTLRVAGESELNGNFVLALDENERTFSKGEGSQGQHQILIETQGSTTGRLYVDRNSGQLLTAQTTNRTSVSIASSGRIQHFIQNSTELIQKTR